jgi:hypothetical protein
MLLQKRSDALDQLHDSLEKVTDKEQLLPQLPQLMVFMQQLLLDHNFRVSLRAMQILGKLAGILQSTVALQLRWVLWLCYARLSPCNTYPVLLPSRSKSIKHIDLVPQCICST